MSGGSSVKLAAEGNPFSISAGQSDSCHSAAVPAGPEFRRRRRNCAAPTVHHRSDRITVSTQDSDSCNLGSIPSRTYLAQQEDAEKASRKDEDWVVQDCPFLTFRAVTCGRPRQVQDCSVPRMRVHHTGCDESPTLISEWRHSTDGRNSVSGISEENSENFRKFRGAWFCHPQSCTRLRACEFARSRQQICAFLVHCGVPQAVWHRRVAPQLCHFQFNLPLRSSLTP